MSLVAYASSDEDTENEVELTIKQDVPKKREPVKISIPSLNEFKEEDVPEKVSKPKPKGGSGLFSILPPPKNSALSSKPGFTPYVFSKKKEVKPSIEAKAHPKKIQYTQEKTSKNDSNYNSEILEDQIEDKLEDTSVEVDFFSLNSNASNKEVSNFNDIKSEILITDVPKLLNSKTTSVPSKVQSESLSQGDVPVLNDEGSSVPTTNSVFLLNNVPEQSIPFADMIPGPSEPIADTASSADFKKFFKLSKREMDNISIIDVNAADQLTGKDEWILQSLTQEKVHRPSKRGHDFPTQQQKRKHQITYLAHQAKERELDLKNQWALNSRTRRETQAKYGF